MPDDEAFLAYVAERLATLPYVRAVTLGGSRAAGTHGPDSDWNLAVYYRGPFEPARLRGLGWPWLGPASGTSTASWPR
jgi:predicted nucleotidyltransferase